jgi:arylsulfatase A-like enzyme
VHGFRRSFDLRGDVPGLLNVHGNPTQYYKSKFGKDTDPMKTKRIVTDTHNWMIGGVIDVPPEETRSWRLGDKAVSTVKELTGTGDPFFLRVSFHAPHVACSVPPEYYIEPKTIKLPFPTPKELKNKPEFEKGPLRTYASATLSKDEIGLCRGTYYGMISVVDVQVKRILDELKKAGEYENTIIDVTSDQGFQLGEHGLWKKRVFYDANVKVPLIIHYPKALPRGKTINEPVELIDFLPTLQELSGIEVPADIRGRSLMPLIRGERNTWRKACFSEIDHSQSMYKELRGTGRRVMVRTKEWKLIYFMDERVEDKDGALYSLTNDPGETQNLYNDPAYKDVIQELEEMAQQWDAGNDAYFF